MWKTWAILWWLVILPLNVFLQYNAGWDFFSTVFITLFVLTGFMYIWLHFNEKKRSFIHKHRDNIYF